MTDNKKTSMKAKSAVALSVVLLAFAAVGVEAERSSDDERYESFETWREDVEPFASMDWSQAETKEHSFIVPAGTSYAFTMDWATGEARVDLGLDPLTLGGGTGAGGCVTDYDSDTPAPWAVPGLGVNEQCVPTEIDGPLATTTHFAETDGSSSMTSASYSPSPFSIHSVLLVCENSAAQHVAWPDAIVEKECTVYQFGTLEPGSWPSYRGNCGLSFGSTEGVTACVHTS